MIYTLEDDSSIREMVVYTLNSMGLAAKGFAAPQEFWQAFSEAPPSLLLLDIMLPYEDGISILKKIRSDPQYKKLPIIMLTARGSEYDKVVGFDLGADDYVVKPFGVMELVARVKALLRRTAGDKPAKAALTSGNLSVSEDHHAVTLDGLPIKLTLKEFDILLLLMKNPETVFSRDQLLSRVWGYAFDGENRTVDVHIRTLRQKLGTAKDHIKTIRGVGYKFVKEL